ncbi:hypothetical protein AB0J28_22110 [Streptosporangium canum]|uniref:hypothetical protein n=1 Tax=Streptosporangium canum TaxID=324952 RepID=UPI003429757B
MEIFIGLQGSGKSTFYRQVPTAPYSRNTAGSRSTGRLGNGACPAAAAQIALGAADPGSTLLTRIDGQTSSNVQRFFTKNVHFVHVSCSEFRVT